MPLTIRCMRETFGSHGHRVGAVESPLTFHTDPDSGACIARLADGRKHHFYQLFFDHENRRVVWSQRGAVELQNDIDRMFYSKYSNDIFVFVGFNSIAVVSLKPPSLESLATWCLQKSLFPSDDSKVGQTGGLTPAQVKECCRRQFLSLHFKSGTAEPGASEAGQNDVGATSGDSDPATEGADSGPTADQVDQTSDDSTWKTGSDNPLPDVVEDSGPCAPSQSPAEEVK